jgi:hypothetical protein
MEWYNEPPFWRLDGQVLTVTSDAKTDFWRKTTDGAVYDNGHFYYQPVSGDFIAQVKFGGAYADQYDQAGLMVRLDEATWIKCGVELENGMQHAAVVVTHDYSDYSLEPLPQKPLSVWMQMVRSGGRFEIFFSLDGQAYRMIRQAYLTDAEELTIGVMTASPMGNGFTTVFEGFGVRSPG